MSATCGNCRFSHVNPPVDAEHPSLPDMFCRRYPPVLVNEGSDMGQGCLVTTYPQTDPDEWCGEYKRAEMGRKCKSAPVEYPPSHA